MSEEKDKPRPNARTAGWIAVGIAALTLIAIQATGFVLEDHSPLWRVTAGGLVGITVYPLAWAIVRCLGVRPPADSTPRDPVTGRRLPRE